MIANLHLWQSAICYNYFTWNLFILYTDTPRTALPLIVHLNGYLLCFLGLFFDACVAYESNSYLFSKCGRWERIQASSRRDCSWCMLCDFDYFSYVLCFTFIEVSIRINHFTTKYSVIHRFDTLNISQSINNNIL